MAPPIASPTISTGRKDAPVPGLSLLQLAQEILLRPVEIRLLVHFRASLARRHRQRADMHAIGLGALQQRDMLQIRRDRLERAHQIAQHVVVDGDLPRIAPAVDEIGLFIERGVDEMRRALQLRRDSHALRGIGKIEHDVAGTIEIARLAPRQRYNLRTTGCAEVPQRGIAHEPGGAGHHDFLACHFLELPPRVVGT